MSDLIWPDWAAVTDIGDGRWRIDLDGHVHGTRIRGHATAGSLEPIRRLVDAIESWPADAPAPAVQDKAASDD